LNNLSLFIFNQVGGQIDFVLGAMLCPTGKAIIAVPSTTHNGESRIVSFLKPGASVATSREHVQYIVTEYGIASLFGKTIPQRMKELIKVAHPNHRERLEREFRERYP
jgi:4-hydroxybutyrate CoA-transferase